MPIDEEKLEGAFFAFFTKIFGYSGGDLSDGGEALLVEIAVFRAAIC